MTNHFAAFGVHWAENCVKIRLLWNFISDLGKWNVCGHFIDCVVFVYDCLKCDNPYRTFVSPILRRHENCVHFPTAYADELIRNQAGPRPFHIRINGFADKKKTKESRIVSTCLAPL